MLISPAATEAIINRIKIFIVFTPLINLKLQSVLLNKTKDRVTHSCYSYRFYIEYILFAQTIILS